MRGWPLKPICLERALPRTPPEPADPNAPYLFRPAPAEDDGQGLVTLDQLYHLSRSL